ncbi:MAG TPA: haloacid dehalogenase-like hydrolase [Vicinamibacterales bacterium]|nr:haloacid dehalogenase-like hydrolase [Vicinamibacterales bacterium]
MLVLFDIDGTLILSGRAGIRGMNRTFERLFEVSGALNDVVLAGRTDRAIVTEALVRAGQPVDDEAIMRVRDAYLEDLRDAVADTSVLSAGVLPGVPELLDELAREHVAVGLLTGNFEEAAAIKLGHYGLWNRFAFGAFGDHHVDRRSLVKVAVDAAMDAGHGRFEADRIVVIGDTPLDVDCAHAYGARAIAVATGPFSHEALAETGPALTVGTLTEVNLRLIGSL